jgi:hypothetical protein
MKPATAIFRALLNNGERNIVPREWHLSARSALTLLQGLEKKFVDQMEKHAGVDPKLAQYLKKFKPEEIAGHIRYIQEIQQDAR